MLLLITKNKLKKNAKDFLQRYEKRGISLDPKEVVVTKINNYTAFVLKTNIKFENVKGVLYQAMIIGEIFYQIGENC